MPVAALVEAARALRPRAPAAIRVALARLLAAGRVERDERGRYRLGAAAAPVQSRRRRAGAGSRAAASPWDGGWWACHDTGVGRRGPRARRHARALRLLGFRRLAARARACAPRTCARAARGAARGAAGARPRAAARWCSRLRELDPETDARARDLYDAPALRAALSRARFAELEASSARLDAALRGRRDARVVPGRRPRDPAARARPAAAGRDPRPARARRAGRARCATTTAAAAAAGPRFWRASTSRTGARPPTRACADGSDRLVA